jgi:hypothetical protein
VSNASRKVGRNARTNKLVESSYKVGFAAGAKDMASRSMQIMQEHLNERAVLEWLGDLLGYIGLAVSLSNSVRITAAGETRRWKEGSDA